MDLTPSNLQIFFTGLSTLYQQGYTMVAPWWSQVAMDVPSDTELETFGWMDIGDKMREWLGPRQAKNSALRSRSLTNRDFELTRAIPRNKFLDDKLGLYGPLAKDMGWQAAKLHDIEVAKKMQENPICFDGKAFFAVDHPLDIDNPAAFSGAVNNNLMDLALTPTNFGLARARMRNPTSQRAARRLAAVAPRRAAVSRRHGDDNPAGGKHRVARGRCEPRRWRRRNGYEHLPRLVQDAHHR